MRIGLKNYFYKNINKQQYVHTKNVARLVDCENWSKKNVYQKILKEQYARAKSVATLVDSKNFSKKYIYIVFKNNTHTQKVLLD